VRRLIVSAALFFATSAAFAEPLPLAITTAVVSREPGGSAGLTLTLSADSAKAFGTLTTTNVGKTVDIRIDGKTVLAPVIRDPILGGELRISGNYTRDELAEVAALISSGTARVEAEVKAP
jgi:preprotein translocase subunit SecD